MTNLIVLFALLFGAQEASALMLDSMPATAWVEEQGTRIKALDDTGVHNEMMGDRGVQIIHESMKQSPLYALLMMLDSDVPLVANNAKYVAMVNEVHQTNVVLRQLVVATERHNQLLEQRLIDHGNQYG